MRSVNSPPSALPNDADNLKILPARDPFQLLLDGLFIFSLLQHVDQFFRTRENDLIIAFLVRRPNVDPK
jgi:hypothetical protein